MNASLAVQRLMKAALADIPGITGVFDGPPVDAASPYLVIGSDIASDWSTKTETGREHRVVVNIWHSGPGVAATKSLIGDVETRLAGLAGTRDGHRLVLARLVRSMVLTDPDGWSQGIVEFRFRTIEA